MLTHHTSSYKHSAKLLVLPLLAVCLICCTKSMYSPAERPIRTGNIGKYKGNTVEIAPDQRDTVLVEDPKMGKVMRVVIRNGFPIKFNNKDVITMDLSTSPVFTGEDKDIRKYLLKKVKNNMEQLPDGNYIFEVNNIVVDEKGNIVYFEYPGISKRTGGRMLPASKSDHTTGIDSNIKTEIDNKIFGLLQSSLTYIPGKKGKENVMATDASNGWPDIKVQNHQLLEYDYNTQTYKPI